MKRADVRSVVSLQLAAALVAMASLAYTAANLPEARSIQAGLVFGVFIALGEVLRVTLPGGRQAAPLAAAGALAFALLPSIDDVKLPGVAFAVTVVTLASILGSLPRVFVGRGIHVDELSQRVLMTATAAALIRPWLDLVGNQSLQVVAMVMAGALAGILEIALAAAIRANDERVPFSVAMVDEFRAMIGITTAVTATGVLMALAAKGPMGYWALPVFAVPMLLTQFSFRRYASIEATYLQTIRALSKVTEVGGYTESGHARRVSALSSRIGSEMGMTERELTDLEYAALMHDIGQLAWPEPFPGGATSLIAPVHQRRIAELGAEVVRQSGALDSVAVIVERQADAYRPQRGLPDATLPLASRIIKVANAYDDSVGSSLDMDRMQYALDRLAGATDREYDPAVVDALGRIVERRLEQSYS
jgi:hypothetical protein